MLGFSESRVHETLSRTQECYNDLMKFLKDDMQSDFVNQLVQNWKAPDAVTFFRGGEGAVGFTRGFSDLNENLSETFNNIFNSINASAHNIALASQATYTDLPFNKKDCVMTDNAVEGDGEGVYIQDEAARNLAELISPSGAIYNGVKSALDRLSEISTNWGLYDPDGSQKREFDSCMSIIERDIMAALSNYFTQCTSAIETSIKNRDNAVKTNATENFKVSN